MADRPISDDLVRRAVFGQLTPSEREWLLGDEMLVEFGDVLRATITRIQMQIEQFHRRSLVSPTAAEDEAWLVRSGAVKARAVKLWSDIRPRYRQLRSARYEAAGPSTKDLRRAIEEHRLRVLDEFDPTEADRSLWAILDRYESPGQ